MSDQDVSRWRNLLRYRMARGLVIPPDARVDPASFPEDEFPVYCRNCDYLLRGLTENRCPECGLEFDRGRLLVEQYVIETGARRWRRTGKWAKRTGLIGFLLMIAPALVDGTIGCFAQYLASPATHLDYSSRILPLVVATVIVGCSLMLVGSLLYLRVQRAGRKQREAVFNAIDRSNPSLQMAQKRIWILWVIWGALMAGLFAWEAMSDDAWFSYYADKPSRAVVPVGIALGIGLVLFPVLRIRKRWWAK